jgi:hypothetical protein
MSLTDHDNLAKHKSSIKEYWNNPETRPLLIGIVIIVIALVGLWWYYIEYNPWKIKNQSLTEKNQNLAEENERLNNSLVNSQLAIQKLELDYQPFKTLTIQKIGTLDRESMLAFASSITNLYAQLELANQTITKLEQETINLSNPKTLAARLNDLNTTEVFIGANSDRVYYLYETNYPHEMYLILTNAPVNGTLNVDVAGPDISRRLHPPALIDNFVVIAWPTSVMKRDINNYRFVASYTIDPSKTNLITKLNGVTLRSNKRAFFLERMYNE